MMRQSLGRGVGAVRARERIADEDVAELRKLAREGRIILLFALVETKIFQHGDTAVVERSNRLSRFRTDAVVAERDRPAEKSLQRLGNGLQRKLGLRAVLRPAEMRDHDNLGAAICERLEARSYALKPCRIGHLAVLDGHVEIGAHDHALARDVDAVCRLQLVEVHAEYQYVRRRRNVSGRTPSSPRWRGALHQRRAQR